MTGWFVLFFALLFPTLASSQGEHKSLPAQIPWQQIDEEDGVTVYRRQTPGSRFVEFRGVGEVEAPIPKIIAMMADVSHMPDWIFGCIKGELVERNFTEDDYDRDPTDYHQVIYGVNSLPWPLHNRDYVLLANVSFIASGVHEPFHVILATHAVEHHKKPQVIGYIRMPQMRTTIVFTPMDNGLGRTLVDFSVITDPGGLIPDWVTNMATRDIPRKTITALREFSKGDNYSKKMEKLVMHHYLHSIPSAMR